MDLEQTTIPEVDPVSEASGEVASGSEASAQELSGSDNKTGTEAGDDTGAQPAPFELTPSAQGDAVPGIQIGQPDS